MIENPMHIAGMNYGPDDIPFFEECPECDCPGYLQPGSVYQHFLDDEGDTGHLWGIARAHLFDSILREFLSDWLSENEHKVTGDIGTDWGEVLLKYDREWICTNLLDLLTDNGLI